MIKTKILVLLFFLFTFSVCAFAQGAPQGDAALSNGGTLSENDKYNHISSINSGIVFADALQTLDYRMDTGILARFEPNSDKIQFSTPTTKVMLGSPISINIETSAGNLRQVDYRISTGAVPSDYYPDIPYILIWSSASAETNLSSGTFSVVPQFDTTTVYYVEWYAQNTEGDWRTYTISVEAVAGVIANIIRPLPEEYVSRRPEIEVYIETNKTFKLSNDVKMSLFNGGVCISSTFYKSTDDTERSSATVKFRYNDAQLGLNTTYTLKVEVSDTDNPPKTTATEVTFHTVKHEGLYQFLPYPSPYNPNLGVPFKIKYAIGEDSQVDVNIYDRAGKLVSRVVPSLKQIAGEYVVDWNARSYAGDNLANGVYICEIKAKGSKEERKYISFAILRK
ncbi:MAG: hypothetical protein LBO62_07185 [Endomicrobium sp.]|jgi:hypothetical protein|nr:hypothetical protein [Endomicrobium sp.]